jgi:glycosyltransferase involved in cell wall biosynthesis
MPGAGREAGGGADGPSGRPVRVAVVGDYALTLDAAPGSRMLWLARSLAERGFAVTVGGVRAGDVAVEGVTVVTVGGSPRGGALARLWFHHQAALRLLARRALRRADAYWVRGPVVAPLFCLLGRLTGRPVLWDFHGFLHLEQGRDRTSAVRRVTAGYTRLLERLCVALADCVVAAGDGHRWQMEQKFPDLPVRVLSNGIGLGEFRGGRDPARGAALKADFGIRADEPVVVFVGKYQPYWWRDAFGHVARAPDAPRMVVLGEWPDAGTAGDGPAPLWLGAQPHPVVVEWLRHAVDVAVCPYRHDWVNADVPHFLNSARKLLEYAASGLPIVLPDIPAAPDFLVPGEHCLLYRPGDGADLAAQVRRLLSDPEARRRMGEANRALAARFEWGALVDASGVPEWLRAAARKASD